MATIEDLKRKISTAEDLYSIVKTMKALAAVSIRQYERAVESLAEYNHTLEMGIQILLQQHPKVLLESKSTAVRRVGIVVFGSDWGMCGQFNDRIANYTRAYLEQEAIAPQNHLILAVGNRIGDRLQSFQLPCETRFTLPSSVSAITPAIGEVVLTLEAWRKEHRVDRIILFHNQIVSGAFSRPTRVQIFPLDPVWLNKLQNQKWSSRSLPTFSLDEANLAAALFRQYFFVSLYRACAESLKCENISRLTAMQLAEKNIAERLTTLTLDFNQQRQTTITEELLDIVSGFEALS